MLYQKSDNNAQSPKTQDSIKPQKPSRNKPYSDFSSSFILKFQYIISRKVLKVWFKSGGVYEYNNVSYNIYEELRDAKSKGRYFWENIRGHNDKYPFTKIKSFFIKSDVKYMFSDSKRDDLLGDLYDMKSKGENVIPFRKYRDVADEFYLHPDWGDPNKQKMKIINLSDLTPTQSGVYINNLIRILNSEWDADPKEEKIEIGINEEGSYILHGHHRLWIMQKMGISRSPLLTFDIRGIIP